MASGDPSDKVYGLPYTGSLTPRVDTFPVTQTVLNMNRQTRETISRQSGDDHYTTAGNAQAAGDLYHE